MEKLLRPRYGTVALVMAVCLGLMALILPRFPDKACNFSLWAFIVSEYVFASIIAVCVQLQALRQSLFNLRLTPVFASVGLMFLVGAVGIVLNPVARLSPDGVASIGLAQLTIMNLGILFSLIALTGPQQLKAEEIGSEDSDAAASTSTKIKRLTQIRIKALSKSHDSLPAQELPVDYGSAQSQATSDQQIIDTSQMTARETAPRMPSQPISAKSQQESQTNHQKTGRISVQQLMQRLQKPGGRSSDASTVERPAIAASGQAEDGQNQIAKELPPEIKRLPSVNSAKTQVKAIDPNKPTNSAISKLQALSASGTGAAGLFQPGNSLQGTEQAGLRSVLDRLDNEEAIPTNVPMNVPDAASAHPQVESSAVASTLFKESVDKDMDNAFAKIVPAEAQREITNVRKEPRIEPVASAEILTPAAPFQFAPAKNDLNEASIEQSSAAASTVFKQPVDKDMDNIFAKIAPSEAQKEVSSMGAIKESVSAPATDEPKVFKEKVDNQLEDIFSGLAPAEAQKEVKDRAVSQQAVAKTSDEITGDRGTVSLSNVDSTKEQKSVVPELKDFGRLSARASAEHESSTQAGTMKTIGKLLIDAQSVENIIKKAESGKITINLPSARVISLQRGQGIQNLLESIDNCQGVEGSMLVGGDGLVISSTFATAGDRDGTGVLAHGMVGNTNLAMLKLDIGKLEQMIMVSKVKENNETKYATTVLTDVEVGMLAVFLNTKLLAGLDQLIETITTIAHG